MSQQEILDVLKNRPEEWFSSKDLAEIIGTNISTSIRCCTKLKYSNFVDIEVRKIGGGRGRRFYYQHKKDVQLD